MPYTIHILPKYLHIEWHGVVTNDDLGAIFVEIPQIARRLGYAPDLLHTYDKTTDVKIAYQEVSSFSHGRAESILTNRAKSAVVANNQLTFGITRMFQSMNRNPAIVMEIFPTKEAAIEWILSSEKPEPSHKPLNL